MFFLAPFKSLYSSKFYLEYIKKSGWTAFAYTVYIFVISAFLLAGAAFISAKPQINGIIDRIAFYMPAVKVEEGKITVNNDQPLTIAPAELMGYKIQFNTGSTEPVYPTEMERSQSIISVTSNKIFFNFQGDFHVNEITNDMKFAIDSKTILNNKPKISVFVVWFLIAMLILAEIFRIPFMILLGFVTAAVFNGATSAGMPAGRLFKLGCYMQMPALLAYIINFVSPVRISFMFLAYLAIFAMYCYFIFSAHIKELNNSDTANKA